MNLQVFVGKGKSKKEAKIQCAEQCLKWLEVESGQLPENPIKQTPQFPSKFATFGGISAEILMNV